MLSSHVTGVAPLGVHGGWIGRTRAVSNSMVPASECHLTWMARAQVLMMVGINPVSDALGRVNKLEVIPLEELGRPRVDVVVNCSGVFRDLFVNQMNLLDRAIKMAAEQDEPEEMNFVRKHARQQVLATPLHAQSTFTTATVPTIYMFG